MAVFAMNPRLSCLIAAAALGLAACSQPAGIAPLTGAEVGGPFSLVDQNGRHVTQADFAGRYPIYYFGYTYCPDICPIDMQKIAAGLKQLEAKNPAKAAKVVPVFVSVDPERDTPAVLKQFVSSFHPRMMGLTGTPAEIARVAKEFAVYYKVEPKSAGGGYLVDHSTLAFLMGPDGKPIALIAHDQTPDQVAALLDQWVR